MGTLRRVTSHQSGDLPRIIFHSATLSLLRRAALGLQRPARHQPLQMFAPTHPHLPPVRGRATRQIEDAAASAQVSARWTLAAKWNRMFLQLKKSVAN